MAQASFQLSPAARTFAVLHSLHLLWPQWRDGGLWKVIHNSLFHYGEKQQRQALLPSSLNCLLIYLSWGWVLVLWKWKKNPCYWLRRLQEPFGSFVILSFGVDSQWGGENETTVSLCVCVFVCFSLDSSLDFWWLGTGRRISPLHSILQCSHIVRHPRWCKLALICLLTRSGH